MTAQAIQTESLTRAVSGNSTANYLPIIAGFMAMGIPADEIQPRRNVFTYNAWRALGRQVSKGQHGVKATTFVPVSGKKATDGAGPEAGKRDGFRMPRTVTVFHVSQTEAIAGFSAEEPAESEGGNTLPAEQIEAIDQQTAAFVRARMSGTPVSFRYVDGTHETFNMEVN